MIFAITWSGPYLSPLQPSQSPVIYCCLEVPPMFNTLFSSVLWSKTPYIINISLLPTTHCITKIHSNSPKSPTFHTLRSWPGSMKTTRDKTQTLTSLRATGQISTASLCSIMVYCTAHCRYSVQCLHSALHIVYSTLYLYLILQVLQVLRLCTVARLCAT